MLLSLPKPIFRHGLLCSATRCSACPCHLMVMGLCDVAPHMEASNHYQQAQETWDPWTSLQILQRLQWGHQENEGEGRRFGAECSWSQLPPKGCTTLPQMEGSIWYWFFSTICSCAWFGLLCYSICKISSAICLFRFVHRTNTLEQLQSQASSVVLTEQLHYIWGKNQIHSTVKMYHVWYLYQIRYI